MSLLSAGSISLDSTFNMIISCVRVAAPYLNEMKRTQEIHACKYCTLIIKKTKFWMRSGAKSYMRKGFLKYEEMQNFFTIYSIRRPLVIYDFAPDPSEFPYM